MTWITTPIRAAVWTRLVGPASALSQDASEVTMPAADELIFSCAFRHDRDGRTDVTADGDREMPVFLVTATHRDAQTIAPVQDAVPILLTGHRLGTRRSHKTA